MGFEVNESWSGTLIGGQGSTACGACKEAHTALQPNGASDDWSEKLGCCVRGSISVCDRSIFALFCNLLVSNTPKGEEKKYLASCPVHHPSARVAPDPTRHILWRIGRLQQ